MPLSTDALIAALADGRFHTGEELGGRFGVSKAAIWKAIKKLADLNLDVHSIRGKGYRLSESLNLLDKQQILDQIPLACKGQLSGLELLSDTESTNTYAMQLAQHGSLDLEAGKAWACFAEGQQAGRGRRGRQWVSPFGHNMYLSVVREFVSGAASLDGLSLVVGLALVTALDEQGYKGVGLKWPNDVLLNGKKLAGILLEMTGDMTGLCHVVIGVGLNLRLDSRQMSEVDQPWTSLDQEGYKQSSRNQLCGVVLGKVLAALHMFEHSGFASFISKWKEYDVTYGRELVLSTASGEIYGKGKGVAANGALLMETAQGDQMFHGGEVSLRMSEVAE